MIIAIPAQIFSEYLYAFDLVTRQLAFDPQFSANLQSGIFWIIAPLKAYVPQPELAHGLPWYFVKIPMEAHFVGYLDVRVALIEVTLMVALIVVCPAVAARRSEDVQIAGWTAAIGGVTFGLVVSGWNLVAWPFSVNGGLLRLMPVVIVGSLMVISGVTVFLLKHFGAAKHMKTPILTP